MDAAPDTRESGLGPEPSTVGSIVVVRPGGLAAMVRAVPALRHLRSVYVDSAITVCAHGSAIDLLEACPYVDDVVDLAHVSRRERTVYDLAILLGAPGDEETAYRPAARQHVAYRDADQRARHPVHPVWPERLPDAYRMLHLVWLLGGSKPDISLSLWPTLSQRNRAAHLVDSIERPIALVHPGAVKAARRWPIEQFARAMDALSRLGLEPVVVGLQAEQQLVQDLRAHSTRGFTSLVGVTSVGVLAGLMERAALFIGNDSGPAALASALDLQSVVIGPSSRVEQTGAADKVAYVTRTVCETCGEIGCAHALPDAYDVPIDDALAQVVMSAESARRRWQRQQFPH